MDNKIIDKSQILFDLITKINSNDSYKANYNIQKGNNIRNIINTVSNLNSIQEIYEYLLDSVLTNAVLSQALTEVIIQSKNPEVIMNAKNRINEIN